MRLADKEGVDNWIIDSIYSVYWCKISLILS